MCSHILIFSGDNAFAGTPVLSGAARVYTSVLITRNGSVHKSSQYKNGFWCCSDDGEDGNVLVIDKTVYSSLTDRY